MDEGNEWINQTNQGKKRRPNDCERTNEDDNDETLNDNNNENNENNDLFISCEVPYDYEENDLDIKFEKFLSKFFLCNLLKVIPLYLLT